MKDQVKKLSFWSWTVCLLIAVFWRVNYHSNNETNGYNATTWDALGYYMYLPTFFIYDDVNQLDWFPEMDEKYQLTGGEFYQASLQEDSTYVFKYLGGTAIMQSPFFLLGHLTAKITEHPADGFSAPYQYAIIWGAVFWFAFGLWILKKVLQHYFDDKTTAITLLLLTGATNLIQYVSVDGAMSHAFIFPLYALLLWLTVKWHQKPKVKSAFFIGGIIGLATISRPTEAIMILIPILWKWENNTEISKWKFLKSNKKHLLAIILGGIIGILPQLIYWKLASGDWIYNVGSKWFFLNPWWRVLFGFEKGWFIYTPMVALFIGGLFMMKKYTFKTAVIAFVLINIWIIISWSDWQYGASYSTRALTHSYPIYAIAMAVFVKEFYHQKLRIPWLIVGLYFIALNQFQIWQYNKGIIHYRDMNLNYYGSIYWNAHPTALDFSLLDTEEQLSSSERSQLKDVKDTLIIEKNLDEWESIILYELKNPDFSHMSQHIELNTHSGIKNGEFLWSFFSSDTLYAQKKFRLALPFRENGKDNIYEHDIIIPKECDKLEVKLQSFGKMEIKKISSKFRGVE